MLKYKPMQAFTLRDILALIRSGAIRGEVNSILHKLVHDKGEAVRLRATVPWGGGVRVVAAYRWRLPSDPPPFMEGG